MPILREAFAEFSGSLWKLSKTLFTKALETQQNAFYESVLGSSYWYFMKIESDSVVLQ
ncbi:hypothetical protein LEP1GSC132_2145 [Leptospira kirschneri str. 200803703]|uniref:hypothetical protein n=1 Tax=Leptospira kirschneri TaxID=29507 RepID=UPI0002BE8872|nr:hypothetical protein [Leptospira kirschneri]EMO65448.1 hypothetical protein LEP1GSC132_2145 [Leptospira kirschneri str. 200803703]